jgi:hypothetical protein
MKAKPRRCKGCGCKIESRNSQGNQKQFCNGCALVRNTDRTYSYTSRAKKTACPCCGEPTKKGDFVKHKKVKMCGVCYRDDNDRTDAEHAHRLRYRPELSHIGCGLREI